MDSIFDCIGENTASAKKKDVIQSHGNYTIPEEDDVLAHFSKFIEKTGLTIEECGVFLKKFPVLSRFIPSDTDKSFPFKEHYPYDKDAAFENEVRASYGLYPMDRLRRSLVLYAYALMAYLEAKKTKASVEKILSEDPIEALGQVKDYTDILFKNPHKTTQKFLFGKGPLSGMTFLGLYECSLQTLRLLDITEGIDASKASTLLKSFCKRFEEGRDAIPPLLCYSSTEDESFQARPYFRGDPEKKADKKKKGGKNVDISDYIGLQDTESVDSQIHAKAYPHPQSSGGRGKGGGGKGGGGRGAGKGSLGSEEKEALKKIAVNLLLSKAEDKDMLACNISKDDVAKFPRTKDGKRSNPPNIVQFRDLLSLLLVMAQGAGASTPGLEMLSGDLSAGIFPATIIVLLLLVLAKNRIQNWTVQIGKLIFFLPVAVAVLYDEATINKHFHQILPNHTFDFLENVSFLYGPARHVQESFTLPDDDVTQIALYSIENLFYLVSVLLILKVVSVYLGAFREVRILLTGTKNALWSCLTCCCKKSVNPVTPAVSLIFLCTCLIPSVSAGNNAVGFSLSSPLPLVLLSAGFYRGESAISMDSQTTQDGEISSSVQFMIPSMESSQTQKVESPGGLLNLNFFNRKMTFAATPLAMDGSMITLTKSVANWCGRMTNDPTSLGLTDKSAQPFCSQTKVNTSMMAALSTLMMDLPTIFANSGYVMESGVTVANGSALMERLDNKTITYDTAAAALMTPEVKSNCGVFGVYHDGVNRKGTCVIQVPGPVGKNTLTGEENWACWDSFGASNGHTACKTCCRWTYDTCTVGIVARLAFDVSKPVRTLYRLGRLTSSTVEYILTRGDEILSQGTVEVGKTTQADFKNGSISIIAQSPDIELPNMLWVACVRGSASSCDFIYPPFKDNGPMLIVGLPSLVGKIPEINGVIYSDGPMQKLKLEEVLTCTTTGCNPDQDQATCKFLEAFQSYGKKIPLNNVYSGGQVASLSSPSSMRSFSFVSCKGMKQMEHPSLRSFAKEARDFGNISTCTISTEEQTVVSGSSGGPFQVLQTLPFQDVTLLSIVLVGSQPGCFYTMGRKVDLKNPSKSVLGCAGFDLRLYTVGIAPARCGASQAGSTVTTDADLSTCLDHVPLLIGGAPVVIKKVSGFWFPVQTFDTSVTFNFDTPNSLITVILKTIGRMKSLPPTVTCVSIRGVVWNASLLSATVFMDCKDHKGEMTLADSLRFMSPFKGPCTPLITSPLAVLTADDVTVLRANPSCGNTAFHSNAKFSTAVADQVLQIRPSTNYIVGDGTSEDPMLGAMFSGSRLGDALSSATNGLASFGNILRDLFNIQQCAASLSNDTGIGAAWGSFFCWLFWIVLGVVIVILILLVIKYGPGWFRSVRSWWRKKKGKEEEWKDSIPLMTKERIGDTVPKKGGISFLSKKRTI